MIILINGKRCDDYVVSEVNFNYDAIADTFALTRPFFEHWEKNAKDNKISYNLFTPLRYYDVQILDDNRKVLITGTLLNHNLESSANANEISLSGYSKIGILDDCPNVPEAFAGSEDVQPTEGFLDSLFSSLSGSLSSILGNDEDKKTGDSSNFESISLRALATKFIAPFGIKMIIDTIVSERMDSEYKMTTAKQTETIASILSKAATLKNIVMRSTPTGELLFTQVDPNQKAVARFFIDEKYASMNINNVHCQKMSLSVNGQSMHSKIYVQCPNNLEGEQSADEAKTGDTNLIVNTLIPIERPTIKKQNKELGAFLDATKSALADELKNITLTLDCKGWDMIDSGTLKTGDIVSVEAPDIYLYGSQRWMIRTIKLSENAKEKVASIGCILPEAMNGENPPSLF
jgi:prophage tail gpP-like protein